VSGRRVAVAVVMGLGRGLGHSLEGVTWGPA